MITHNGGRLVRRGTLLTIALTMLLCAALPAAAQDIDNAGKEFIMVFMPNHTGGSNVELHLTADDSTDVYIEYPMNAPTLYDTVSAVPGEISVVSLPSSAANTWTMGAPTANNTVHAYSDKEFVCYQINRKPYTSDAALGLPVDVMNTDYIVIGHRGANHNDDGGEFAVIAREDNTEITITPANALVGGYAAGTPFTITLNRGEAFLGRSSTTSGDAADLTGTLIEATKPIGMVNGNKCTNIPVTTVACDHVFEVAQPIQSWGKRIFSTDLPQRDGGSLYRVVAAADSTVLSIDGVVVDTLNRGEFYERSFFTGDHVWEGSNGIFVVQFMTSQDNPNAVGGDPAMGNLAPSEQYLSSYTFATPGIGQFAAHYLTVIAYVTDVTNGTVFLDGNPIPSSEFSQIPATDFWAASVAISEGSHTTSSVDSTHGILITGYNDFDSYLYPGGALFVPIQSIDDTIPPVCTVTDEECGAAVTVTDDHVDAAGIFVVRLDNGSENLTLTTDPFDQGATIVNYRVDVTDSTLPASGSVTVIDGEGNSCTQQFAFDCSGGDGDGGITPTYAWINVYCGQPLLNGEPLAATDTIKAYDPDGVLCGMEVVGDDGAYGLMPIYRDDEFTTEDEGAVPGDEISFMINDVPVSTDPIVVWTENGDSYELCGFSTDVCKTIELSSGWNLISWNVQYTDKVDSMLAEYKGCYEVVLGFDGEGQTFVPGLERFATLTDVDFYNGYWIKVVCPFTLEICGPPIDPGMSISVTEGWNLVSYWPETPLPIEDAFTSIWTSLQVALGYDDGALVFVPDSNGFNTLDTLRECFGYWAKVDADGVLAYPGFGLEAPRTLDGNRAVADRSFPSTRRWVSVYGEDLTIDGRPLQNNRTVELVTADGTVIGQGRYEDNRLRFTSGYGRDVSIPGAESYPGEGETFRVAIDGTPLYPELTWGGHGSLVELSALSSSADGATVPGSYALHQNYPNPFNPSTTISFNLPSAGHAELAIYNLLGQKISTLIDADLSAGSHTVEWDGRADDGETVSTGIYFYRLTAGKFSETRKMMMLK